jgi:hypothetical protein
LCQDDIMLTGELNSRATGAQSINSAQTELTDIYAKRKSLAVATKRE